MDDAAGEEIRRLLLAPGSRLSEIIDWLKVCCQPASDVDSSYTDDIQWCILCIGWVTLLCCPRAH